MLINRAFPNRKLYLFDTFAGFDDGDRNADVENRYSNIPYDFTNTCVEEVLKKMKYPENCIVIKGYFPESANNLEESFVFVSIDADLFKPVYAGLCFFYPRMVNGGYIFVHDYNQKDWEGAKYATEKFCTENKINCFPLCDAAGTAVIMK